jgi:crotonobetainyl-CoA:carnitine CoA-transferase CaiB-like acyl-CoA transferase
MCGGFTEFLASGRLPPRQGNQNSLLAPAGAFEVAGGRHITIAILRDSHWVKFCTALELEQLADDPRFRRNADRVQHRQALDAIIVPLLKSRPVEEWLQRLRAADILCGPINSVADVLADPALREILPLINAGEQPVIGSPIRYRGSFFPARRGAPAQGQHTRELLLELGYAGEEIDRLLQAGAVYAEGGSGH